MAVAVYRSKIEKLLRGRFLVKLLPCRGNSWRPRNVHFDPEFEESIYGSSPRTHYGGRTLVTLVKGLGKDDALWDAINEIVKCSGAPIEFEVFSPLDSSEEELESMMLSIRRNGIAFKGNIESRKSPHLKGKSGLDISRNMMVRKELDLFVRINEIKSLKPLSKLMKNHKVLDMVLIRQNTEGEFSLLEYSPLPHMCEHLAIVTRYNSRRVAEYAFNYAKLNGRNKITLILNQNIIPVSEAIFSNEFLSVSQQYPDVKYEMMDIVRFSGILLYDSKSLDVILASSLIGSIICSILQGFLGSGELVPSLNAGEKYQVWETAYTSSIHHAPIYTDNPISHILSVIAVLRSIGYKKLAEIIAASLEETLTEGVWTKDMGGKATLDEFTMFLIKCLMPKVPGIQCDQDATPTLPTKPPPTLPFQPDFLPGMSPPNPNYKENPSDDKK